MAMRTMNRAEVSTMLRLAKEVHDGTRELPPEIKELRKKIADSICNAELWMMRLNMTLPQMMIDEIVAMKLSLDALYCIWTKSETPTLH